MLVLACLLPRRESVPAGGRATVEIGETPPTVAITFDDGPKASTTARLLDELALREVPATFFLVGREIADNEELVRRMAREGHQIGVHSYAHIRLTGLSRSDFDADVGRERAQLSSLLGEGEFWLRPPYGWADSTVQARAGAPIVMWSVDTEDWKYRDAGHIAGAVLGQVQDGDIILFHDIYDSSVDGAIQVVDALLARGYCFATVEQLLALKGIRAENGTVYRSARPEGIFKTWDFQ